MEIPTVSVTRAGLVVVSQPTVTLTVLSVARVGSLLYATVAVTGIDVDGTAVGSLAAAQAAGALAAPTIVTVIAVATGDSGIDAPTATSTVASPTTSSSITRNRP